MVKMRGDPGKPLPNSFEEAWKLCWADISGIPDSSKEIMRLIFYRGGVSALHQANAGRYLQLATDLNENIFQLNNLSPSEITETIDALRNGTYEYPSRFSDITRFKIGK